MSGADISIVLAFLAVNVSMMGLLWKMSWILSRTAERLESHLNSEHAQPRITSQRVDLRVNPGEV